MCYSAQIVAEYKAYVRLFGARMDIKEFYELFWRRNHEEDLPIAKGLELAFSDPATDEEREIKSLIDEYHARQAQALTEQLFVQKNRLATATRKVAEKPTKAAEKEQGIAGRKVAQHEGWLADLRRTQPLERDFRIFPKHYAPVMIVRDGERVVVPMRYQCRPAGKPVWHDKQFPGTYNARRTSLEDYWKGQFGRTQGIVLWDYFYENVAQHKVEGRPLAPGEKEKNVVLQFDPTNFGTMMVACIWSHWKGDGNEPDLYSFAAITDEPPPEVAAAGHDRCIIPLKQQHIDAWLNPDARDLEAQYAILDDRERPYYDHSIALAA